VGDEQAPVASASHGRPARAAPSRIRAVMIQLTSVSDDPAADRPGRRAPSRPPPPARRMTSSG
jgi:hypothetical protein